MSALSILRNRTISVSHETFWKLQRIAKAQEIDPLSAPETADGIAERFLKERLQKDHPMLTAIYRERKALDDKATEHVKVGKDSP